MSDRITNFLARAVLALVGLIGLLAAVHMIALWPIWAHARAPEWVGAIGTVGTLAGTIWLATSEVRRRHRQETDAARLIATRHLTRVALATNAVKHAKTLLENSSDAMAFKNAADCLYEDIVIDQNDLATMVPLGHNVALVLAKGLGERDGAKQFIRKIVSHSTLDDDAHAELRHQFASDIGSLLNVSWIHMTQAVTIMTKYSLEDTEITIDVPVGS